MAETGAIRAGKAFVELFADESRLSRGLQAAAARLKAWGAGIASVGSFVSGVGATLTLPFIAASKIFESMGSALNDMSARTGASVETLSELAYAAEQSGGSIGDVETMMRRLNLFTNQVATGNQSASASLAELKINAAEFAALNMDQRFDAATKALSGVENESRRSALAVQIFGRSAQNLVGMFSELNELREKARRLGLVVSAEDAKAADEFGDMMGDLWKVLKMVAFQVGAAVAPAIMDLVGTIVPAIAQAIKWAKENRGLIMVAFKVAVGIAAVGSALIALGGVISFAGAALGGLVTVAGLLLNPFVLIPAILIVAAAAVLYFTDSSGKALDWLRGKFAPLEADAKSAFGGIANALKSGEIGLAAKVAWTYLRLQFLTGLAYLISGWEQFKAVFVEGFETMILGLALTWIRFAGQFESVWAKVTGKVKGLSEEQIKQQTDAIEHRTKLMEFVGARKFAEASEKRGAERTAKIVAAAQEAAKAQMDFEAAVKAANQAKLEEPKKNEAKKQEQIKKLELAKADVTGSFSVAVANRQGIGTNLAQKQLDALEKIEANMKDLLQEVRDGGGVGA